MIDSRCEKRMVFSSMVVRGGKGRLYEGGIRSPLIVWGPGLMSPSAVGGRDKGSVLAAEVMKELGVPVNDFYGLLVSKLELARGDQFHWRPEAYRLLADAAAESIIAALQEIERRK